jgi:lysyl-tRNA synthetase class 2
VEKQGNVNTNPFLEENDQTRARREHLESIRALVGNPYPNLFVRTNLTEAEEGEDTITSILNRFRQYEPGVASGERPSTEQIESANAVLNAITVRVSGRIATPPRVMGKAAFVHLSDGKNRLQIYVRKADVKAISNDSFEEIDDEGKGWELFSLLDHGDFIGVEGFLFVTRTGELSIHVTALQFLAKALLPMPDKMHGIADPEIRQRQRYADLIAGSLKFEREDHELTTREVFELRARIIREMRRYLDDHGYIEVETPMLAPKATGAAARPFVTHHKALDIPLYARIAPELYLKRLLVGGFERVYELNRNFRNEGLSTRHNPEFTMLEFYCAYMDVNGMMDFCEEMLQLAARGVVENGIARFGEQEIDFGPPFERLSMRAAIERYWTSGEHQFAGQDPNEVLTNHRLDEVFEAVAEEHLIQPTFITGFPKPISPLAKASPLDPTVAERFELFIAGMEVANGFSELNDPHEQQQRFEEQMQQRERGNDEAMILDEDYIRALSYGMPPAAGIGIGIDRIVMLLTGRRSIRDVILFPHMRPERKAVEDREDEAEVKVQEQPLEESSTSGG